MNELDPYLAPPRGCWPNDGLGHHIELVVEVPCGPGVEIIAAELLLDVVKGFTAQGLPPDSVFLHIDALRLPR